MNAFQFGSSLLNKKADDFRGFQFPKPGTPFRIVNRSASDPKNDVPSWNDLPGNRPSPKLPAAKSPPMVSIPQQTPQQKQPPMVSIPQRAATGGAYPPISPAGSNNNAAKPVASYDPPMPASAPRRPASALTLENILPGSAMSPVRKAVEGATGGGMGGALGGMALGMGGGALTEKYRPGTLAQLMPEAQKSLTDTYDRTTSAK